MNFFFQTLDSEMEKEDCNLLFVHSKKSVLENCRLLKKNWIFFSHFWKKIIYFFYFFYNINIFLVCLFFIVFIILKMEGGIRWFLFFLIFFFNYFRDELLFYVKGDDGQHKALMNYFSKVDLLDQKLEKRMWTILSNVSFLLLLFPLIS